MKQHSLHASERNVYGKKVKALRSQGLIPATMYGKGKQSVGIAFSDQDFEKLYKEVGETGLVEVKIGNASHHTLVHVVDRNPMTRQITHVELHEVNLREKVHANIPLVIVGNAKAVSEKKGTLLTLTDAVEVEALPTDLPEKIDVDVTNLADVDDEITVAALVLPETVTLVTDTATAIVRVAPLVSKESEELASEENKAAESSAENAAEGDAAPAEDASKESQEKPSEG